MCNVCYLHIMHRRFQKKILECLIPQIEKLKKPNNKG